MDWTDYFAVGILAVCAWVIGTSLRNLNEVDKDDDE